jgi:hypothetical protein
MSSTQEAYKLWKTNIYDEVTSATWFENAFNISEATENRVLKPGHFFLALTVFSDGSPIDKQMKHSEHPS